MLKCLNLKISLQSTKSKKNQNSEKIPEEEHQSEHLRWARGSWLYLARGGLGEQCGKAEKQV